jgi:excisionase family DNA binding protein
MSKRVPHKPPGTKTREEAAQYLGVSLRTLYTLVKTRKVRCLRPTPRTPYFRTVDLDAFLLKTANVAA